MLKLLNADLSYDDFDICNSVGIALRPQTKKEDHSKIRLYPNPANHIATLLYDGDLSDGAVFALSNSYGQVVKCYKLNVNNRSFTFNTSDLNPRSYFCTIQSNTGLLGNDKLIIIH